MTSRFAIGATTLMTTGNVGKILPQNESLDQQSQRVEDLSPEVMG